MPTPAEQKALAFVALVILLGGAARIGLGGATAAVAPSAAEREALARQSSATDSAAESGATRRGSRSRKRRGTSRSSADDGAMMGGSGADRGAYDRLGFPPPLPRIDSYGGPAGGSSRDGAAAGARPASGAPPPPSRPPRAPVDVDRATVEELEALPWVGPALARRIAAARDSLGPFGTLDGLSRVKGIGPATLRRLAPFVTFSGQARR